MGVLGFTPFLQKICPGVVKQLPQRFRALSGKRIVIDGTLITQRFHYAPMPQQSRHVLCWYRLAKHLKSNNVEVVCVFDGKQRSLAKEREVERRRRDRILTSARGAFETVRVGRLHRLAQSVRTLQSLGQEESKKELAFLRQSAKAWKLPETVSADITEVATSSTAAAALAEVTAASTATVLPWGMTDVALKRIGKGFSIPAGSSAIAPYVSYDSIGELEVMPHAKDLGEQVDIHPTGEEVNHVAENITQIYTEYCHSVPQLVSLSPTPSPDVDLSLVPVPFEEEADAAKVEHALSKSQHGLALEESHFWAQLVEDVENDTLTDSLARSADLLAAKSNVLSESYSRRTHPPTSQSYQDSKEILRAMGIPCVEPSGPFEAEALAASLVLNGQADLVASEDTDVLIYDAPLVRNITSMHGPLVLISGQEVRAALDLDRARFIDLALLLGTDFSQRIKNVGPTRALKLIRKHGSIEQIIEHETQYPPRVPSQEYLEQVALARTVFQTLPPTPEPIMLMQNEASERDVMDILDKHHLRRYALDEDYSHALSGNYFADDPAAV